jgi:hypothetical protein
MQKQINYRMREGFEGTCATHNYGQIRGAFRPMINKSGAIIPYGRVVVYTDANRNAIKLPTATGQIIAGISYDFDMLSAGSIENPSTVGYGINSYCSVYNGGAIDMWVFSETATDIGSPVFFRHTAVAGTSLGRFRQATATNFDPFPNCVFTKKTLAAGLTTVQIMSLMG